MYFLRNFIVVSLFLTGLAHAVNIVWIEYDPAEQKLKGALEYFGIEDQEFRLELGEGTNGVFTATIVEVNYDADVDESSEEEAPAKPAQKQKHHLKKWERKKLKKEAEAQKKADAKAARAEEEEAAQELAAQGNHEQPFEFDFEDAGQTVYFVVNGVTTLIVGGDDAREDNIPPPPSTNFTQLLTQAEQAAPFSLSADPQHFGNVNHASH